MICVRPRRVEVRTHRGDVGAVRPFLRGRPRQGRRPYRGFSLIELVMVICILAILTTVAIPRFARSNLRVRLEADAQRVAGDLKLARQRARRDFASDAVAVGTTWTEVSANLTPAWSGDLIDVTIGVATQSGTTPLRIDDISLVKLSAMGQFAPVPGT